VGASAQRVCIMSLRRASQQPSRSHVSHAQSGFDVCEARKTGLSLSLSRPSGPSQKANIGRLYARGGPVGTPCREHFKDMTNAEGGGRK
jgi:hypothetical protein